MKLRTTLVLAVALGLPAASFADFKYQETTKITGGAVVSMMKMAGAFSKQARQANQPITSTVLVKGNKMARVSPDHIEIIDLDAETITNIDTTKKQYSVMTFQQMKQEIEQATREAQKNRKESKDETPEMTFDVKVRNTGATKQVAGLNTTESILTMAMKAKDKQSGESGTLAITNDMWMAPDVPGYKEVQDFNLRWAQKLGIMVGSQLNSAMMAMQPGAAKGMAELAKEMSKLKGVPVLQVMRMGSTTNGKPLPAASEGPLPESSSPQMPKADDVADDAASSAASSALTGKLGKLGGLGGFGGFGRKKKQEQQAQEEKPKKQANEEEQPSAAVLIESSTETSGFSSAPIAPASFSIPAGFKQVEPDSRRGR